jgi:hypothetical protein
MFYMLMMRDLIHTVPLAVDAETDAAPNGPGLSVVPE